MSELPSPVGPLYPIGRSKTLEATHAPLGPIIGLDVLRFSAASFVMCFHFCVASWANDNIFTAQIIGGRAAFPELLAIAWFGWVGVEIFFVISGLFITYSAAGTTAKGFILKRFIRLYPAAWACATITTLTLAIIGKTNPPTIAQEWLYSVALSPLPPWVDGVYWTIGIEIVFYGFIFLVLLIRRSWIEHAVVMLGAISSAYWIGGNIVSPDFLMAHLWDRNLELSLIPYGCFFAAGATVTIIHRQGFSILRVLTIGLSVLASAIEIQYKAVHFSQLFNFNGSGRVTAAIFLIAVLFIICSIRWRHLGPDWAQTSGRNIGQATYPLYLVHNVFGAAVMKFALNAGCSRFYALAVAIISCIFMASLSTLLIEPWLKQRVVRFVPFLPGRPKRVQTS